MGAAGGAHSGIWRARPPYAYLDEAAYGVALAATLAGLAGLHARLASGRGGRAAGRGGRPRGPGGGSALGGGGRSRRAGRPRRRRALSAGLLGLGLAGLLVGFVLSGVATLMAGLLPRWCGLLLIVCLPLAGAVAGVLGEPGGGIALGLVWLALGYVLASRRDLLAWLGSGRG